MWVISKNSIDKMKKPGSIGTPQILMLSGVGDKDEVSKHGIPLVQDTPEVGKNLQDHLIVSVPFKEIAC